MASPNVEVGIRGIAAGGSGIGDLPDGRVVFVPRTAPGDRARIRIEKSKTRWALGSLQSVLEPGPDRAEALCELYASCGGCQLQHLTYERQLAAKASFVSDALQRIGGFRDVEHQEVVASPRRVGYRNRITFTLRRLSGGYVVAGFHALGRPAHVIDVVGQCVLPADELNRVWLLVRAGWGDRARNLPEGGRLRLTLRLGSSGVELIVEGGEPGWSSDPLVREVPDLASVWHAPSGSKGDAVLVSGTSAPGGGTAFAQVNPEAAELLRNHVLDVIRSEGRDDEGERGTAIDAYCGTGEYGRALAREGWSVTGIEVDRAAAGAAAAEGADGFEVVRGRVEDRLAELLPADLIVLNPPRTGLHTEVPTVIKARAPKRLIYVSCDPATLARDLGALSDVYELESVCSFDLFPQTAHVETVAVLRQRRGET